MSRNISGIIIVSLALFTNSANAMNESNKSVDTKNSVPTIQELDEKKSPDELSTAQQLYIQSIEAKIKHNDISAHVQYAFDAAKLGSSGACIALGVLHADQGNYGQASRWFKWANQLSISQSGKESAMAMQSFNKTTIKRREFIDGIYQKLLNIFAKIISKYKDALPKVSGEVLFGSTNLPAITKELSPDDNDDLIEFVKSTATLRRLVEEWLEEEPNDKWLHLVAAYAYLYSDNVDLNAAIGTSEHFEKAIYHATLSLALGNHEAENFVQGLTRMAKTRDFFLKKSAANVDVKSEDMSDPMTEVKAETESKKMNKRKTKPPVKKTPRTARETVHLTPNSLSSATHVGNTHSPESAPEKKNSAKHSRAPRCPEKRESAPKKSEDFLKKNGKERKAEKKIRASIRHQQALAVPSVSGRDFSNAVNRCGEKSNDLTVTFLNRRVEETFQVMRGKRKIQELITEITANPRGLTGTGRPEHLKYNLKGHISRRIAGDDRLVYRVTGENEILVVACETHYDI